MIGGSRDRIAGFKIAFAALTGIFAELKPDELDQCARGGEPLYDRTGGGSAILPNWPIKKAAGWTSGLRRIVSPAYFFLASFAATGFADFISERAAWAAARRATGTRKGEQLT